MSNKKIYSDALHQLYLAGLVHIPAADILTASEVDFVNKGAASEMFAGLEMMKYHDCFAKAELHYWQCQESKSQAEIDYVVSHSGKVLPIEVKASTQGSMQSLWIFLREHKFYNAIRTSLENFGHFYYYDKKDNDVERHVDTIPLYALSNLQEVVLLKSPEEKNEEKWE